MSGRRRLIYFDTTQNERGRLDTTYSELGSFLRDHDFDVEPYTEFMILAKKIEEADVIVFGCPNSSKLRPAEIDVLKSFVQKGGGLMLLSLSGGDRGLMNNMSQVSKEYGITFENTAIKDERNNAGLPTMPLITDIEPHVLTEDVTEMLYPSGCSLSTSGKAVVIAKTSDMAEPSSEPIIAAAEHGKGRVLCIGSYEIFRIGGGLKHDGNRTFALNAFRWLAGETRLARPSRVAAAQESAQEGTETVTSAMSEEVEKTLRRLVNAVFDLQKDIAKATEKIDTVEKNIEMLRDQFQDFAEKTQKQLGIIIPSKQFQTAEEKESSEIESDIKSLEKEIRSVRQLRDHVEDRHSSGAMKRDVYDEQVEKLDIRIESLQKRIEEKKKSLEEINGEE
ncbi:MAG: hypothetical protein BAJATHORv1_10446 [Candidatus Thorarchaeota archaeon]|nr:MAG: hypothetical protein BAJATHORv1_10446 [Candidatus Thorarchaeota archaeon]